MRPRAVLFDCDGVLVDSEPPSRALLIRRLADAGLPVDDRQINELFLGGTLAGLADRARALGADLPPSWVDDTYEAMFQELRTVAEIPGARRLLQSLTDADIPFAICSNGPMRKMEVTLGSTGMWDLAKARILSAHVHAKPKPAPDLYLMGAELCETPPEHCIIVEDSATGARAARAAGISCLALAVAEDRESVTAEGAEVIASLEDVRERLGLSRR